MASIAQRTSEDPITEEDPGYEMVLEISTETRLLLSRLAAESGGSEFDVIGKDRRLLIAAGHFLKTCPDLIGTSQRCGAFANALTAIVGAFLGYIVGTAKK
jgi:hypothetical protein